MENKEIAYQTQSKISPMKKTLFTLLALTLSVSIQAQINTRSRLDSIRSNFEHRKEAIATSFNEEVKRAHDEYEKYERKMHAEYQNYVNSIKSTWGKDNVVDDTQNEWVEYGNDYKSRSVVDFEKGDITVEVVLDDDVNENDTEEIEKRLADAIERMLESKGSTDPYSNRNGEGLTKKPILDGLVDLSMYDIEKNENGKAVQNNKNEKKTPPAPTVRGKELPRPAANGDKKEGKPAGENGSGTNLEEIKKETKANERLKELEKKKREEEERIAGIKEKQEKERQLAEEKKKQQEQEKARQLAEEKKKQQEKAASSDIAKAVAKQSKKSISTIKGEDNKERKVVKVNMALVNDNLSKSASLYKDYVAKYSNSFGIEEPLIFAVIEQESSFNPEAKSWVPAYGLMQLVPKSGGFDAYRYVYKREWVPTMSYLYVPHQNIELGTAYLRILMNQFKNVTDPDCRRLCVIASYNTGAGNVCRAFTGKTNIKAAVELINKMSYDELYRHLTNKLSTDEARKYVSGVSRRREKYIK